MIPFLEVCLWCFILVLSCSRVGGLSKNRHFPGHASRAVSHLLWFKEQQQRHTTQVRPWRCWVSTAATHHHCSREWQQTSLSSLLAPRLNDEGSNRVTIMMSFLGLKTPLGSSLQLMILIIELLYWLCYCCLSWLFLSFYFFSLKVLPFVRPQLNIRFFNQD